MNPFKPGDIVRLRSGGPRMTVERVGKDRLSDEEEVSCVWTEFDGKKQNVKRDTFPPVVLDQVKEPATGAATFGRVIR